MLRRDILHGALAGLSFAVAAPALAQDYPMRPIMLLVPYAPGGATDIIGRVIAEELSHGIGQRVVVENRAGATGSVGAAAVARAAADGYTLLLGALTSHAINMGLQARPGFDLKQDFAPITLAGTVGLALVVHPSVQAKTIPELVALAKATPHEFNYASTGNGSPQHLAGEMFNARAGTMLGHVPYRGSGPAMTDLVGGQIKVMFDTIPSVLRHVKAGSLKAIATTGREPSPFMPDYPTAISQGLADFEIGSWFGVLAPAGTPRPIVEKLNAEIGKALKEPRTLEAMKRHGITPRPGTPDEAAALVDSEIAKWGAVIKTTGLRPE